MKEEGEIAIVKMGTGIPSQKGGAERAQREGTGSQVKNARWLEEKAHLWGRRREMWEGSSESELRGSRLQTRSSPRECPGFGERFPVVHLILESKSSRSFFGSPVVTGLL